MPLDVAGFNSAFSGARYRVRNERADAGREQARLRELVPDDASAEDREWALGLIELLGEPPEPPRQWSALYHQAGEVAGSAYQAGGTVDEQIAAIADARRKIWEIADRAAADEAPHIRAMTRVLEHLEDELRNPTWPTEDSPRTGN
ncbi:hypothetical protein [Kribbella monticola]|uniref:hypothetical protein n=1 Tax=Kribbella monticola TaxID=2185285 RepID=UPI000DD2E1E4|nr:hypothetical protein [Kribbella monticola]